MPRLDDEDRGVVLSLRASVRAILGEREASLEGIERRSSCSTVGTEVEATPNSVRDHWDIGDFEAAEAEGLRVVELVEQHDLQDHLASFISSCSGLPFTRRPTLSSSMRASPSAHGHRHRLYRSRSSTMLR